VVDAERDPKQVADVVLERIQAMLPVPAEQA
jgi:hypothetical protein